MTINIPPLSIRNLRAPLTPNPPEHDFRIINNLQEWLNAHPEDARISPLLIQLKDRGMIELPPKHNPAILPLRPTTAPRIFTPENTTAIDIENAILAGDAIALGKYASSYPKEFSAHIHLIKMHLKIGTLSNGVANHLLNCLPINHLIEIFLNKDPKEKALLEYPHVLQDCLPILLKKLPTDDLHELLTSKSDEKPPALSGITKKQIDSLSQSEILRLTTLLEKDPTQSPTIFKWLPSFALRFHRILQDQSPPSEIIQQIRNLADLNEDDKDAAIAHWIEYNQIPLQNIFNELENKDVRYLAPYLRYVDCRNMDDLALAQNIIRTFPVINSLFIDQGKMLKDVAELPQCLHLDCNNCGWLSWLPNLPQCISLDCSGCNSLEELPDLPQCITLDCSGCNLLEELPDLPLCQDLNCSGSMRIPYLPDLPECFELDCSNCEGIEELLELPSCRYLNCSNCDNLETLFNLPECRDLDCSGCVNLKELPNLPHCKSLDYRDCELIEEIPQLPFNATVTSDNAMFDPTFEVDLERLTTEPLALLNELGRILTQDRSFPTISYFEAGIQNEGVDATGLSRDFITRLCTHLFKEEIEPEESDKFLPKIEGSPLLQSNHQKQKEGYRNLGILFAHCNRETFNLKTGPLFHRNVYSSLTLSEKPNSDVWFARNYLRPLFTSTTIVDALMDGNEVLPILESKDLMTLAMMENEEGETMDTFSQDYLVKNRSGIRDMLLKMTLEERRTGNKTMQTLEAISLIAQSMAISLDKDWDNIKETGAEALQNSIEGVLSKNILKEKLRWQQTPSVNPLRFETTKNYLLHWIDQADIHQLSSFVYFVTGSKALSAEALTIVIWHSDSAKLPTAHTCDFHLDLPDNFENQIRFNQSLQIALEYAEGFGFA